MLCVTTETRHLDRLDQLGEFEQDSNTDSEQESNTEAAQCAKQSTRGSTISGGRGEEAPHSKEQST